MRAFSRHPKALPFLFLTEMWERFGFYVVQGMLVLYITKVFKFSDDMSFTITGLFSALAYISPMVGGWLADKYLGFKEAIFWGGFFLVGGYALLALPIPGIFYLALATIIVGNGLFKPNISSLLGALYAPDDPARDAGFTIFYIGINIGVLLAGLSSGYVKDQFGWHIGFALASIGILIGLGTFALGVKLTGMKYKNSPKPSKAFFRKKPMIFLYAVATIAVINLLMRSTWLSTWLLPTVGLFLLVFLSVLSYKEEAVSRKKMLTLIFLIVSSIVFWTIFLQMFLSVNLFIDRLIDRTVFGISIPTTAFYSLESVFVILIGPLFAFSWQTLNRTERNPSPLIKFAIGIACASFGYLILVASTYFANSFFMVNPLWIVAAYFSITVGELFLSPIGLAAVTILSPPKLRGLMMGIWFVAMGFGGQFAGWLAKLSSISGTLSSAAMLEVYRKAFFDFFILAFSIAVIIFLIHCFFRKMFATENLR